MDKQTGPKGFLVVLPGEIIEIPQDSDKSWLTLFYSLPRELAEKWKPAYDLSRSPYEVLRTVKYDRVVCDDMHPRNQRHKLFAPNVGKCLKEYIIKQMQFAHIAVKLLIRKTGLQAKQLYGVQKVKSTRSKT